MSEAMAKCRTILSWCFCWLFMVLVGVTAKIVLNFMRHQVSTRALPLAAVLFAASLVFACAWWTGWKRKNSARTWGLLASLLSLLAAFPMLYFGIAVFLKTFLSFYWPVTVLGIVGLIAFSLRRKSYPA
jgi:hypothetical protein